MDRKRHTTRYPGIYYRLLDEERPDGPRRYIVWWTDANGIGHTETFPVGMTLEEARQRQAMLKTRKAKGDRLVPTKKTISELLDEWLELRRDSLKPKTIEDYEYAIAKLKKAFGNTKVRELSASQIARYISLCQKNGMKTWTIKKILTPLSGALKVAVREGWIQASPADALLPHERPKADQKEMRCLSSTEIPLLLQAASSDRWRTLFATLTFTGLRISEALSLTWDDVTDSVRVKDGKTESSRREIMLIPSVATLLRKHRLAQPPGTEYVFANASGQPVSRREALRALRTAEKRAGLLEYTLHELRHTFASILIAQGETPVLVAHQMGHKDASTTLKTYAHLFDEAENVQLAKDRLQQAFGGVI